MIKKNKKINKFGDGGSQYSHLIGNPERLTTEQEDKRREALFNADERTAAGISAISSLIKNPIARVFNIPDALFGAYHTLYDKGDVNHTMSNVYSTLNDIGSFIGPNPLGTIDDILQAATGQNTIETYHRLNNKTPKYINIAAPKPEFLIARPRSTRGFSPDNPITLPEFTIIGKHKK